MITLPFQRIACLTLGAMTTVLLLTTAGKAGAFKPAVEVAYCSCNCGSPSGMLNGQPLA